MANIKIEIKEEAVDNVALKFEKEETWMSKSKLPTNCEGSLATSYAPDVFSSCIDQEQKPLYFKREENENRVKVENYSKDCYSDDISEPDDKPLLKYKKPQNGFMQGYWPNPDEIDFDEFAKEIASECMDDIPLDFPTDLPKVPGTKYVDLVVRNIPSFNCSLDSSDDEKYSVESTSEVKVMERGRKKVKISTLKREKNILPLKIKPEEREVLEKGQNASDMKKEQF